MRFAFYLPFVLCAPVKGCHEIFNEIEQNAENLLNRCEQVLEKMVCIVNEQKKHDILFHWIDPFSDEHIRKIFDKNIEQSNGLAYESYRVDILREFAKESENGRLIDTFEKIFLLPLSLRFSIFRIKDLKSYIQLIEENNNKNEPNGKCFNMPGCFKRLVFEKHSHFRVKMKIFESLLVCLENWAEKTNLFTRRNIFKVKLSYEKKRLAVLAQHREKQEKEIREKKQKEIKEQEREAIREENRRTLFCLHIVFLYKCVLKDI